MATLQQEPSIRDDHTDVPMFASCYNYFVGRADGVMGYNARTGSFALLAADVAEALQSREAVGEVRDAETLLELGFLHLGDELQEVARRYTDGQNRSDLLFLTLAPTLGCNMTCHYCYQNEYRADNVMSPEVQAATLAFIRELVVRGRKEVICEWYGGEPLLALDVVLNMSSRLREVVAEAGGHLQPMRIITNGVLLNSEVAQRLSEVGITNAQVSFDSLYYDGKSKRGVLDLNGDPSIILRNVLVAQQHLGVNVRVNVSDSNSGDAKEILRVLDAHGLGQQSYFARVEDFDKDTGYRTDSDGKRSPTRGLPSLPIITGHGDAISRREYARLEQDILLGRPAALEVMVDKLKPKTHFCSATDGSMYVIDPAGDISRCWHSAGSPSEAMGNVLRECAGVDGSDVAGKWASYNPFRYAACSSCKVLPLCMGGCCHARVFMEAKTPPCESIKNQIQHCVDEIGSRIRVKPSQVNAGTA